MSKLNITIRNNGPLFITAEDAARLQLTDHQGNVVPLPEGKGISLCRCGASKRKPFCDSSHRVIGFDGTFAPPPEPTPPAAPTPLPTGEAPSA